MTQHTELIERLTDEAYEWSRYVVEDRAPSTLSNYLEPHIKAVANALEAQAREIEGLRKDAERYQFLRDTCWLDTPLEHVICLQLNAKWDRAIDEAIDAAMKGQP